MSPAFTTDDLACLLERLAAGSPERTVQLQLGHVRVEWDGIPIEARMTGTNIGRLAIALASPLGSRDDPEVRHAVYKLLEHLAGTAATRLVIENETLTLESRIVPDEVGTRNLDEVTGWRLAELCSVACAWRRHLHLDAPAGADAGRARTLDELVRSTPVEPQQALLVATVGFAVAGADGNIATSEAARLREWMLEIPSFTALDLQRVVAAIATLADDPARTLLEAMRRLDPRERLLAWALANDMAHADGFPSEEERRYLSTVASIFELSADAVAPLVADAQQRAVRRETLVP